LLPFTILSASSSTTGSPGGKISLQVLELPVDGSSSFFVRGLVSGTIRTKMLYLLI
jgi:hypothetical protein